ncbi:penicillin-binding protein 2 [Waterburya agarophytonicola K14]|uniref:Penicillin-binding protein 2 n=1 Tax=Waterburya agarophytonicola KI4 TaxID=2874699 RepID=A0A964BRR2_9CYAN|nr:penicillin-binding protein 2 [Waterburya agarophytonicola]MCC0177323.1 penicillin-binding protein 2 [Waterburya agarophytonicola KI4]
MTKSRFKLPLRSNNTKKKPKGTRFHPRPFVEQRRLSNNQKNKSQAHLLLRLFLVWGVLVIGTVGLAARLYYLQIVNPIIFYEQAPDGKRLTQIAQDQQTTKLSFYIPRRQIVDRDRNVLATDRITYTLYVHPHLFKRNSEPVPAEEIAEQLSDILGNKTPQEFLAIFQKQDWGIRLAEDLPESVKEKIAALQIDGLDLKQNYSRFYPHREMAAEVTGYVNLDSSRTPQAGIEYTQNKLLERDPISWKMKRSFSNNKAVFHPGDLERSQQLFNFDDLRLQLTIDLRLQQIARNALKKQMKEYDAKRGTVIVMDVRDGAIAALVSEPTYDPNTYYKYEDFSVFKNWAVTDLYEPGSTFKPINIALALDAGVISPQDTFNDTGEIKIKDAVVRNHDFEKKGARGELTLSQILQYSSNVGMIKVMRRIEPLDYYRDLQKLGIEDKVEFDIPGYTTGRLKNEVEFTVREIEPATTAFGQGFSLTPLKLIQIHAALANEGKLITPHVVRGLSDYKGYLHYSQPPNTKQVFSPKTAKTVLEMMEKVVEDGSGYAAKIPGYRIAGKTGTSQKAITQGGYDETAKITSFVGIFPVEAPRYAVLAVVDEPHGEYTYGSTVAAPIVGSVIQGIINIEGIPPSTDISQK